MHLLKCVKIVFLSMNNLKKYIELLKLQLRQTLLYHPAWMKNYSTETAFVITRKINHI